MAILYRGCPITIFRGKGVNWHTNKKINKKNRISVCKKYHMLIRDIRAKYFL
jgi:hypothetical protein